jgi:hypothetical protein
MPDFPIHVGVVRGAFVTLGVIALVGMLRRQIQARRQRIAGAVPDPAAEGRLRAERYVLIAGATTLGTAALIPALMLLGAPKWVVLPLVPLAIVSLITLLVLVVRSAIT